MIQIYRQVGNGWRIKLLENVFMWIMPIKRRLGNILELSLIPVIVEMDMGVATTTMTIREKELRLGLDSSQLLLQRMIMLVMVRVRVRVRVRDHLQLHPNRPAHGETIRHPVRQAQSHLHHPTASNTCRCSTNTPSNHPSPTPSTTKAPNTSPQTTPQTPCPNSISM